MGTSVQRLRAGSATDEWYTPEYVFTALGVRFDLDPCAPQGGPLFDHFDHHYTASDDGLALPWFGTVWVNPPYSAPAPWVQRLANHGDGLALVFARTETGWWHDYVWSRADALLFFRGRLRFIRGGGEPDGRGHNAPAPSALVAYGDRSRRALHDCALDGRLVDFASAGAS